MTTITTTAPPPPPPPPLIFLFPWTSTLKLRLLNSLNKPNSFHGCFRRRSATVVAVSDVVEEKKLKSTTSPSNLKLQRKIMQKGQVRSEESHGREQIKFGEVVQAPPKLVTISKALKTPQDASQERLCLKAVEDQKQWASRPGMDLPPTTMTSPSF